ncbi:hypothetical protein B0H14DRAFT_2654171 [Mycena olivaceomarginata]|nr:hypothetical protein B0H14DRAFT_2654171 [Mycena olivaceomarginata]
MCLRKISACTTSSPAGGHEQDALLVYNSCTQASEPCCRPGVTWKRVCAAPYHPEQPKSMRGCRGMMHATRPREYGERNEGPRPGVERKGKKKGRREDENAPASIQSKLSVHMNGLVVGEV